MYYPHFPFMLLPFVLLILKESFVEITGLLAIRKTEYVFRANWHKSGTCLLYAMISSKWYGMRFSPYFSNLFITICILMMFDSLVLWNS